ncbi:hypothetical protein KM043_009800 [Ampulex compressa]|nr:hypothetical protein KM043_009800 [Ampulex compressa]
MRDGAEAERLSSDLDENCPDGSSVNSSSRSKGKGPSPLRPERDFEGKTRRHLLAVPRQSQEEHVLHRIEMSKGILEMDIETLGSHLRGLSPRETG